MSTTLNRIWLASVAFLVMVAPAAAADGDMGGLSTWGAPIGIGILVFGAALGISKIGANAVESMARQPEIAGDIRGAMVVAAALIEGAAFFGILMAYLGASAGGQ